MPEPIVRESLSKGLEERYAKQHVGGAFDAKQLEFTNFFSDEFGIGFTRGGANTQFPRKNSSLLAGFSSHRYSGAG